MKLTSVTSPGCLKVGTHEKSSPCEDYGSLRYEMKRNEMVLCEMITGNCKIYCKRKVRKQIKSLLSKSVPESLRICKLVANYKATLVSNRNGFVFVSSLLAAGFFSKGH